MLLGTAIVFGFLGSLHCLGMCAPLIWAMPQNESKKRQWLTNRLAYNFGRTLTYGLLGAVAGAFGQMLSLAGVQQWLSILAGATVIVAAVFFQGKILKTIPFKPLQNLFVWLKIKMGVLLGKNNFGSNLRLGFLNGLLPCGLVYMALVAAVSMGTFYGGAAYMALFGLGTFPMMFGAALFGRSIKTSFATYWIKLMPKLLVVVGLILILRGMNLGIPYLSPKLDADVSVMVCD